MRVRPGPAPYRGPTPRLPTQAAGLLDVRVVRGHGNFVCGGATWLVPFMPPLSILGLADVWLVSPFGRSVAAGFAGPALRRARPLFFGVPSPVLVVHDAVAGTTPSGEAYYANDPELLNWVHSSAAYGFLQAYHAYVQSLSLIERNRYYAEGIPAAHLYGATNIPTSERS